MGSFFSELKRRNVFRVGVFYVIAAWIIMQVVDVVMPALNLPEWTITLVLVLLAIGLPIYIYLTFFAKEPVFSAENDIGLGEQACDDNFLDHPPILTEGRCDFLNRTGVPADAYSRSRAILNPIS